MTPGSMGTAPLSVESVLRAMGADFVERVRMKDIDGLVTAYYAQDAQMLPPNHPAVKGRAQIGEFLREFVESGLIDLTLEPTDIRHSEGIAYEVGIYKMRMGTSPNDRFDDSGKYVVIFRRFDDGSWRAVVDMFNTDLVL